VHNKSFIILIIFFVGIIGSIAFISLRIVPHVVHPNLENLPMQILEYHGTEDYFSDAVYKELKADKHVYRHYISEGGRIIDLYIGYYGTAKGGRTPHNPYGCLPGSGWAIIHEGKVELNPEYYSNRVKVNYIISKKEENYNSMLHWYQSDKKKVLTTGFQQNIQRFIGRVFKNKYDGAFVRISMVSNEGNIENAKRYITEFADQVINLLPEYWQEEK
jgi:EpsI family protein